MQRSLATVTLVLSIATTTAQASCVREVDVSRSGKESADLCDAWNRMASELPSSGKETLQREGIVSGHGGFILSEALVSDCQLRYEMGVYFRKVMEGRNHNERDKEFAAQHSKEIVRVLRRIWPSLSGAQSWAVDGGAHEKYSLLTEPGLQPGDVLPLVSDLLDKEGMNIDLVFVMFSRPEPELKVTLSRHLSISETKKDVPEQIYSLTLLHQLGEPTALPKLKKLSRDKNLSNFERTLIPALLAKIRRGEELKFGDIENLEYENDRTSP